jgi:hypothetical protein
MNVGRVVLAAFAAFVTYFALGFLAFAAGPLRREFEKYPTVYRSQDSMKSVMPAGMAAMALAMLVLSVLYTMVYRGGPGLAEGLRFGALVGLFAVCAFVIHNHVNLNIGWRLTAGQAVAYFIEWTLAGAAIGLVYRPPAP